MAAAKEPDPSIFDANLAALMTRRPRTADALRAATSPDTLRFLPGRDGKPTCAWTDRQGRLCWLGRTSMPSVRAPALVDAFKPGTRNVLFNGFGQGTEIRLLLERLAPHQAVMTVDADAAPVALAMRLHDLADDLARGRLLPFVGPNAWSELRDFLIEHDGYLAPDRVLAWPWFDVETVSSLTERLSEISAELARRRRSKHAERHTLRSAEPRPRDRTIAIISNVSDPRIRRFAWLLRAAADPLGWSCTTFVLDSPAVVHPDAIEAALWAASPAVVLLLDVAPQDLRVGLPETHLFIACTHDHPLAADWVRKLPPSARLGVTTERQHTQAVNLGVKPSHIVLLPPAAMHAPTERAPTREKGILVVAEGRDPSAEAAGLHLASHCRLWERARRILQERCDTYRDDQAGAVLREAERDAGIKLDAEEVREGLVLRVRRNLGRTLVRRAYCQALIEAGIAFDLHGGWAHDPALSEHDRGAWPDPPDVPAALEGHDLIISIEPSGRLHPAILDGIARGLPAFVLAHPSDDTAQGLSAVLDPKEHVWRFDSRRALVTQVRRFRDRPADFQPRAAAATRHVLAHHTWTARLASIVAPSS